MLTASNHYWTIALLGITLLGAGCAARDVDVKQRGPISGKSTVEGDTTAGGRGSATTESQTDKKKSSSQSSGSVSGSGSATGSTGSGN
jgi:hypothetical protein